MPITAITYQLEADSLNAAYRPVIFRCKANIPNATALNYAPPVVFCDVYLNGVYYKTLSKTAFIANDGIAPEYEFDVQDAIQEVMSYNLPPLNSSTILDLTNSVKKVFVKFRNTYFDTNGFIVSEQMAPVQGTSLQVPVSGLGTKSNEIYVYNATLQHEDNQDFKTFLEGWKTGNWNPESFPLTKRPKVVSLCKNDSSYFPIITSSEIQCFELNYKQKGQSEWKTAQYCYPINCVVSEWSAWSQCANGQQTRTRTIITPAAYGGTECPVLSESRTCVIPICIAPTLISATKTTGANTVVYNWNTNGFDYGTGTAILQYSIDGGTTWNTGAQLNPNGPIGTATISGVTIGTAIKYRVQCHGNGCSNMNSNVIDGVFEDTISPGNCKPLFSFDYKGIGPWQARYKECGSNDWSYYSFTDTNFTGGTFLTHEIDEFDSIYEVCMQEGSFEYIGEGIHMNNYVYGTADCTPIPFNYDYSSTSPGGTAGMACALGQGSVDNSLYGIDSTIPIGSYVYTDPNYVYPRVGNQQWYRVISDVEGAIAIQIDDTGKVINKSTC